MMQWTLHRQLYPPWTIVRGPCAHPMHGGTDWYLYKRDLWKKVREKTWALVRALTFINYVKQSLSRALVMHVIWKSGPSGFACSQCMVGPAGVAPL